MRGAAAAAATATMAGAPSLTVPVIPTGAVAATSRFRLRKVNLKTHLRILREEDLDEREQHQHHIHEDGAGDGHDGQNNVQRVETGVDKEEEKAVINASKAAAKGMGGKAAQVFIPVPEASLSDIPYKSLYPEDAFQQPATYIRFSSTVEDCTGVPYCMDERDDEALAAINARAASAKPRRDQCSEDQFEIVMTAFEETSAVRQPFASVDGTPVLTYADMAAAFDEHALDETERAFAADIYEHWKLRKTEAVHSSLMPRLKTLNMDRTQDADDADPYVCFRRREVRQVRKTRGRDAQIIEKLKKLRRELEEGRQLLHWVKDREEGRRDDLKLGRQIFEQRAALRECKRTLNITDEEEDLLITQRTPKRPKIEPPQATRQPLQAVRRNDSLIAMPDFDIVQYRDRLELREKATASFIERRLREHESLNADWLDHTQDFLEGMWSPADELDEPAPSQWVSIQVDKVPEPLPQQQPTPPASVVDENSAGEDEGTKPTADATATPIRWAPAPAPGQPNPGLGERSYFRQRHGRGGLFLDRRLFHARRQRESRKGSAADSDESQRARDLFRYDSESGDDEVWGARGESDMFVDDLPAGGLAADDRLFRLFDSLHRLERAQRAAAATHHGLSSSHAAAQLSADAKQQQQLRVEGGPTGTLGAGTGGKGGALAAAAAGRASPGAGSSQGGSRPGSSPQQQQQQPHQQTPGAAQQSSRVRVG